MIKLSDIKTGISTGSLTGFYLGDNVLLTSPNRDFIVDGYSALRVASDLIIKDGTEGTAGDVWTSTNADGSGDWVTPHTRYADSEALAASVLTGALNSEESTRSATHNSVNTAIVGQISTHTSDSEAHHTRYADSEARAASVTTGALSSEHTTTAPTHLAVLSEFADHDSDELAHSDIRVSIDGYGEDIADLQDGYANHESEFTERIIKSFAGTIDIGGGLAVGSHLVTTVDLPANSIIVRAYVDIITNFTSTNTLSEVAASIGGTGLGNLQAPISLALTFWDTQGLKLLPISDLSAAASSGTKLTGGSTDVYIDITVEGLTAGRAGFFFEYMVGEEYT